MKGRVVLIRKTTAIWLFQETERVSADRLFRVRLKQPYASICTPKIDNSTAVVHDQCDMTGKDDLESDDTAHMIVINDDDINNENEICTKSNKWLKIGSYVLSLAEREMLCNNDWLTDLHMNSVQVLLKKQFPQFGGLQNTAVLQSSRIMQPFPNDQESLQIVHVNNNHWIVATTANCHEADISIYDSFNSPVNKETQSILARLLKTRNDSFRIQIAKVNRQSGSNDCGVFAAAYCTSLAFGQDPSTVVYNQDCLRDN